MKNKENAAAFRVVLDHFIRLNNGETRGAKVLMADALGVSRQVVDHMKVNGIPRKYVRQLSEMTGLKPEQILPNPY